MERIKYDANLMDRNKKLFPQRLWELIHEEKYHFCLRWSPNGKRVYLDRNEFETHYLKTSSNQFHTQKAISFVRQMNMYGFRKVDDFYYENDNFKRNCQHLLKFMVRRHSNKGFFSNNAEQNLQNQTGQHHDSTNRLLYQHQTATSGDNFEMNQRAAAAQCFKNVGGLVGNIGVAMAALNSSSTQTPSASTLYQRLASLNFSQNNVIDQYPQRKVSQNPAILVSLAQETQNQESNRASSSESQFDSTELSTFPQQQQLVAPQALQETLVRSLLQLKQPLSPFSTTSLQQTFLNNLQQQSPNLLLESLVGLGAANPAPQVDQFGMLPLDYLMSLIPGSSSSDCEREDNNSFNTSVAQDHSNNFRNQSAPTELDKSLMNVSRINNTDEDLVNDDFRPEYKETTVNRNSSLIGSSSSSNREMSNYQTLEDDDNVVLNLAKPPTKRSIRKQKSSKTLDKTI